MKQTLYQNPITEQYDGGSCPSVRTKEEQLGQIGHDESITSPRAGSKEATIKLWVTCQNTVVHEQRLRDKTERSETAPCQRGLRAEPGDRRAEGPVASKRAPESMKKVKSKT